MNSTKKDSTYKYAKGTNKQIIKNVNKLFWGNVLAGCLHIVSFIAIVVVIVVVNNKTETLISTDFLREKGGFLIVDTRSYVREFVRYLVAVVPLITGLFHLGIAFFIIPSTKTKSKNGLSLAARVDRIFFDYMQNPRYVTIFSKHLNVFTYYANVIALGINPLRWIEYCVTSSLMIVVIGNLSGISNIFTIVYIVVLNLALMYIGGNYFEQDNVGYQYPLTRKGKKIRAVRWKFFVWGCLFYAAQWSAIFSYFITAALSSNEIPTYVYVVVIGMFGLFTLFAINPLLHYLSVFRWISDFTNYELVYIALSFISKFALDWTLIIGTVLVTRTLDVN